MAGMHTHKWLSNSSAVMDKILRGFLIRIAILFDPLGFLSPYTVRAKILILEIWFAEIDRDGTLLDETSRKVQVWFKELKEL